jgi:hypothetical protein
MQMEQKKQVIGRTHHLLCINFSQRSLLPEVLDNWHGLSLKRLPAKNACYNDEVLAIRLAMQIQSRPMYSMPNNACDATHYIN